MNEYLFHVQLHRKGKNTEMNLIVNNKTEINVILSIDGAAYTVEAYASDTAFHLNDGQHQLRVKRADPIPLPEYKKKLWTDILGGISKLMIESSPYVFDVSSEYRVDSCNSDTISIDIVRRVDGLLGDTVYDIVYIDSSSIVPVNVQYKVENQTDICRMYRKCKKIARFWMYVAVEVLFTLIGMLITYPILMLIYGATGALAVKIIMIIIPFLLIGIIALIGILPLHIVFKIQDNGFYRSMDNKKIASLLANHV